MQRKNGTSLCLRSQLLLVSCGRLFALLQMVDYNESSCPYKYEKIKNLAGERKLARLSLMGQMERTKEKFLFASHLRNQSIFMQFFADLEGYLAETDPSKVSLDFTDLSPIASQAFKELR